MCSLQTGIPLKCGSTSSLLTRYGDDIKGVHCANDNMAYGVIEALKAEGITDMPITAFDGNPEAVELVMKGDLLATVFTNPHWGGGIALAPHQAVIGAFAVRRAITASSTDHRFW